MPDDKISSENSNSKIYSLIKDEYRYCFDFINLYKKDYFAIIGSVVAILAVVGVLINTSDTIYWIPISFFMILLFSIVIILYFFYQSYFIERDKNTDNDFTDVLYLDLFFKNIRPIFYSISLLLLINTICVIIVISGITGVQNIQDVFLNFFSPNLEYAKITINLPPDQKISIENAIKNVETLYILLIFFQTLIVFAFTFVIHKMRPPYPGTKHITKILRYLIIGLKQRKFDQKQILSSLYYSVVKYTDNILRFVYFIPIAVGGFFLVWSFSLTLGQPEFSSNYTICVQGILIGFIQLVAFILLLDYFETSQINLHFFNKLHQINELKTTIELNQINGTTSNFDYKQMMKELNLLNIYSTKRVGFLILFTMPIFSVNPLSINAIDKEALKKQYNFKDEKLMILTNKLSLFCQWAIVSIFSLFIILSIFLQDLINGYGILLAIGSMICFVLLLRWIKKRGPPAFEEEENLSG